MTESRGNTVLKAFCLAFGAWALFEIALAARAVRVVAEEVPAKMDGYVKVIKTSFETEAESAIRTTSSSVNTQGAKLQDEVAKTRQRLLEQIVAARKDLNEKAQSGLVLAHLHASALEEELGDTNEILAVTALPIHDLAKSADQSVPETLQSIERTSEALSKAAPLIISKTEDLESHIDRVAASIDKLVTPIANEKPAKRPWWIRLGLFVAGK